MREHGLGPNGGLVFCMEYLEKNFDWLEGRLSELKEGGEDGEGEYVVFDLPGQVELATNHGSLKRIIGKLGKAGYRVRFLSFSSLPSPHSLLAFLEYIRIKLISF